MTTIYGDLRVDSLFRNRPRDDYYIEQGGVQTVTTLGGQSEDMLTFPALSNNAILQGTLTVQGVLTGDPTSYLNSNVFVTVNGVSGNSFQVKSLTGSCTISAAVSAGDFVDLFSTMSAFSVATILANATGSSSATMNYDSKQEKNGASFAFVLEDASGRRVKGIPLVTGSGGTYPTK